MGEIENTLQWPDHDHKYIFFLCSNCNLREFSSSTIRTKEAPFFSSSSSPANRTKASNHYLLKILSPECPPPFSQSTLPGTFPRYRLLL